MLRYSTILQWSEEDQAYIASVPELPGLSAFGSTAEEAVRELSVAQKLYLETLQEDGEEIPEPDEYKSFSGQTRIRMSKSLHASLSFEAKKEGVSLNSYIIYLLTERGLSKRIDESILRLDNRIQTLLLSKLSPQSDMAPEVESEKSYVIDHIFNLEKDEIDASC